MTSRFLIPAASAIALFVSTGAHGIDFNGLAKMGEGAVKAATLSDADIAELSKRSCEELDRTSKVASPGNAYAVRLAKVMKDMPADIKGQPVDYKVYLTPEVNAWAMSNGCIRVYSGLMDLMNDDELRGVIGHEEGHVALGHTKKAMQTAYATSAARELAGSGGGVAASLSQSQLGGLAEKLVNAQFSQSQESDADNYSFDVLTQQQLKRDGLVSAFQKLAKLDGGKSSMLSSHPSSAKRAASMQKRLEAKS